MSVVHTRPLVTDIYGGHWIGQPKFQFKETRDKKLMRSKKIAGSGGNYVFHSQIIAPAAGTYNFYQGVRPDHESFTADGAGYTQFDAFSSFEAALYQYTGDDPVPSGIPLNWNKFPSSSEFSLLLFVSEFRDTLELFRLKFWKELSYGSVQWGLLPFIGELQAVMRSLANLHVWGLKNDHFPYEDTLKVRLLKEVPNGQSGKYFSGELSYHLQGHLDFSSLPSVYAVYDLLGFHVDPETLWDAVPLSFLFNKFLPFAELIDDLHDKGWVETALFNGWWSRKLDFACAYTGTTYGINPAAATNFRVFERNYLRGRVGQTFYPQALLQSELPSFRDLFNALYIIKANRLETFSRDKLMSGAKRLFRSRK
jgi:hypothetical protein